MPHTFHHRSLDGIRVLMLVGDDYEDLELWYPKLRLEEAGCHVTVAGLMQGRTYSGKHGYPCTSDAAIGDMECGDFQGIVLPGGWMPDALRRNEKVLGLVREFSAQGKLVAAILRGPGRRIRKRSKVIQSNPHLLAPYLGAVVWTPSCRQDRGVR